MNFDLRLYAVTDRGFEKPGYGLMEQLEDALKGGVTLVQLREKEMDEEDLLKEALKIKKLTDRYGVPLIINDSMEVALKADAAGVHLGQEDLLKYPEGKIREILGPEKILGITAKTPEQARKACEAGADYLGSGAVFGSSTKKNAKNMTLEMLSAITASVPIPVAAIGGINSENIGKLSGTGISGAAVVSGIFGCADILEAARDLRAQIDKIVREKNR